MTKSELEMAPRYARYAAAIILPRVPASVAASQLIEALKPLGVPQDGYTIHIASTAQGVLQEAPAAQPPGQALPPANQPTDDDTPF
jgi:hypothetical protein